VERIYQKGKFEFTVKEWRSDGWRKWRREGWAEIPVSMKRWNWFTKWNRKLVTEIRWGILKRAISNFYWVSICKGGLGSRNSVCPSACLSHAWIVTKLNDALQIFWYHTKGQSLCYSDTNSGWWAMPRSIWNLHSRWLEKCWLTDFCL